MQIRFTVPITYLMRGIRASVTALSWKLQYAWPAIALPCRKTLPAASWGR